MAPLIYLLKELKYNLLVSKCTKTNLRLLFLKAHTK